jgi:hypothetical protein
MTICYPTFKMERFILEVCIKTSYFSRFHQDDLDQRIHDEILEKLKGKIKKVILEFGKDQCDYLIDRFGLSEVYREIHEEKNIRVYQKILLVGI